MFMFVTPGRLTNKHASEYSNGAVDHMAEACCYKPVPAFMQHPVPFAMCASCCHVLAVPTDSLAAAAAGDPGTQQPLTQSATAIGGITATGIAAASSALTADTISVASIQQQAPTAPDTVGSISAAAATTAAVATAAVTTAPAAAAARTAEAVVTAAPIDPEEPPQPFPGGIKVISSTGYSPPGAIALVDIPQPRLARSKAPAVAAPPSQALGSPLPPWVTPPDAAATGPKEMRIVQVSDAFRATLDTHNINRAKHVDTPPMGWDNAVAKSAQDRANLCIWG